MKYSVTGTWEIEAENAVDAVKVILTETEFEDVHLGTFKVLPLPRGKVKSVTISEAE